MKKIYWMICFCCLASWIYAAVNVNLVPESHQVMIGQRLRIAVFIDASGTNGAGTVGISGAGIFVDYDSTYFEVRDQVPADTTHGGIQPFRYDTANNSSFGWDGPFFGAGVWQEFENQVDWNEFMGVYTDGKINYGIQENPGAQLADTEGYLCYFDLTPIRPTTGRDSTRIRLVYDYGNNRHSRYFVGAQEYSFSNTLPSLYINVSGLELEPFEDIHFAEGETSVTVILSDHLQSAIPVEWSFSHSDYLATELDTLENEQVVVELTRTDGFSFEGVETITCTVTDTMGYNDSQVLNIHLPGPPVPQAADELGVSVEATGILITWSVVENYESGFPAIIDNYKIYRDTAYIVSLDGLAPIATVSETTTQYLDTSAEALATLGDADVNLFYTIVAEDNMGFSSRNSQNLVVYDFWMYPGLNLLTFFFNPTTAVCQTAEALLNYMNAHMGAEGQCDMLSQWSNMHGGFTASYILGFPANNFGVTPGNPYFFNFAGEAVSLVSVAGKVPHNVSYPVYHYYNFIGYPHSIPSLMGEDFVATNDGFTSVFYYDAETQEYVVCDPTLPWSENFVLKAPQAYLLWSTTEVIWPEGDE